MRDSTGRALEDVDLDFLRQPDGEEMVTPADFTNPAGQFTVVLAGGTYDVVANPPPGSPLLPDTTRAVAVAGDTVVDVVFGAEPPPPPTPAPPAAQALLPVFPNPASGGATLPLVVDPARGLVRISIYDGQGRLVRVLEQDPGGAGQLAVRWDGRRSSGVAAASGVYFVRARQGSWQGTRKLLLLRSGR